MSARIAITELPDGEILIDGQPTDFYPPWKTEDAIRQQSRDIESLRSEMAAAVGGRDELARQNGNLSVRLASAIARLAAIDNAPTVAIAVHVYTDRGPYKYLNFAEHDIPASGVELIARPSKEST